jgi:hypothetical protein
MNIETLLLSFDQINYNWIMGEQKTWNHTLRNLYGICVFTLSWNMYLSLIGSTSQPHTWKLTIWDDNELENFMENWIGELPQRTLDEFLKK